MKQGHSLLVHVEETRKVKMYGVIGAFSVTSFPQNVGLCDTGPLLRCLDLLTLKVKVKLPLCLTKHHAMKRH